MNPTQGMHVKAIFRNSIQVEGIVETWTETKAVLRLLESNSLLVIQDTTADIMAIKIIFPEKQKEVLGPKKSNIAAHDLFDHKENEFESMQKELLEHGKSEGLIEKDVLVKPIIITSTSKDIVKSNKELGIPTADEVINSMTGSMNAICKDANENLKIKNLAELRKLQAEQDKLIVENKLKDHSISTVKQTKYEYPRFFKKQSTE